jgi:phenylacetate-CoA ligase
MFKRDGVNQALSALDRNQWLPSDELKSIQRQKLARLLSFAIKNVPYYRDKLARFVPPVALDTVETVLAQLAPLTKSDIRDHSRALVSEDLTNNVLLANSTSGSTGEALRFFTDSRSVAFRKAAALRSDSWTGWRLGERTVSLWGAPMDITLSRTLRGNVHGWITGHRSLSSYDLSASRMDEYIKIVQTFQPKLLIGYPGPLEQFAMHCEERGETFPSLKAIVSSAEMLWPYQREVIERAFRVRVYNRYGCREVGQVAAECAAHDGLHVSIDRVYLEVVDNEGQPCAPGQTGRILVTDLDNFGMPLIRYEIGDCATWLAAGTCRCGRGFPRIQTIEGRTLEIVMTPDGRRIGGTFWTLLLRSRPGLRQIQVVQEELGGVVVKFVPDANFNPLDLGYFEDRIRQYCGHDFKVEFRQTDAIELTAGGKRRLVISRVAGA